MQIINSAIELAELGYRIFPCKINTKEPATLHGCLDATTDTEKVGQWWSMWPKHNVAISTDGLVVVDVDPMPDGSPNPWLSDESIMADLMRGACSITPRNGRHFWFKQPTGAGIRSTVGKVSTGVDIRADGGYVVAPPSYVVDTEKGIDGSYSWAPGYELTMRPDDLPLPPAWILEAIEATKTASVRSESPGTGNEIPNGQRNAALARLAGRMRRAGMTEMGIRDALRAENHQRCRPPLEDEEVDKIAHSIAKYEPDQVTVAMVEGWSDQPSEMAPKQVNPGELPVGLCDVPGLLGDVIRWNLATAAKPSPPMALAAAIALMGVITGRKITDRRGSRTNVYTICIAPSGAGKEHARKVNKMILRMANMNGRIGAEDFASHSGVIVAVEANSEILFQIDECGRWLKTAGNPDKNPHIYAIITVLLKLYTSSNSLFKGAAYADKSKTKEIEEPHACLYGTTVKESFFDSLTTESLTDGFVGRLLVFESAPKSGKAIPGPMVGEECNPPESIIKAAQYWRDYTPGGLIGTKFPQPRKLLDSLGARKEFDDLDEEAEAIPESEIIKSALWVRAHEKARKLALMYSVSEDCLATEISHDAARWACLVVRHLTRRMEWLAGMHVSENQFDAGCKRFFRAIDETGTSGITATALCRAMQGFRPRERSEILEALTQQGRIMVDKITTGGRPAMVYKSANFL